MFIVWPIKNLHISKRIFSTSWQFDKAGLLEVQGSSKVYRDMYIVHSRILYKVNSVQKACAKCFAVHLSRFEILKTTWKNKNKIHQNTSIGEKLKTKSLIFFVSFFFIFFHVISKVSNFDMWTEKYLAQASCTELTLLR